MPDSNANINRIQVLRTIEMFAEQEDFLVRNLEKIRRAIEQSSSEIVLLLEGRHPRYRRLIQALPPEGRPIGEGGWTDRRLLNLLDALETLANETMRTAQAEIITNSSAIATSVYQDYQNIFSLDDSIPRFNRTQLSRSQIRSFVEETPVLGYDLQEFVERIFTTTGQTDLRNEFFVAALQGEGIPKVTRRIKEEFVWLDDTQINRIRERYENRGYTGKQLTRAVEKASLRQIRHNAITAARTHMQTAASTAMEIVFEENKDIIDGYEWNATMEPGYSRTGRGTCLRCASRDGDVYSEDEERPAIPLHPNCRCIYTPVLKDWEDLGIDANTVERDNRAYVIRETDKEIAVGKGRAIGAGGRKILGPVTRAGKEGERTYSEWYDDRNSLFKVNLAGPSRAAWLEEDSGRSLQDLTHKATGELKLLNELEGNPDIISREQYVEQYGTAKEQRAFRKAQSNQ